MLIENHAGAMPPWSAPVQAVVCCISEPSADYAAEITQSPKKQGFRVESDLRGEKITRTIREHSSQKVPYILVVGDKEKQNGTVAARGPGGSDLGAIAFDDFVARSSEDRCLTFVGAFNIATEKANRINGEIRVPEVRSIGSDGEQSGIVKIADAFRLSEQNDV
ncbi:hypothetical protein OY671_010506, partial [Metschnikowia pulcherrima]